MSDIHFTHLWLVFCVQYFRERVRVQIIDSPSDILWHKYKNDLFKKLANIIIYLFLYSLFFCISVFY